MRNLGPRWPAGGAALLALAVLAASPAGAAPVALRGVLTLEGKQVPLPEGEWVVAARADDIDLVSLVLLRPQGAAVAGAVLVQASRQDARPLWGDAPLCERHDLPFARTRYKSDHDQSCAYVAHVAPVSAAGDAAEGSADPAWGAAQVFAAAHGWALPAAWGVAAIRVAQPLAAVQVRYAVPADPPTGATISRPPGGEALATWTEAAWTAVEQGLRNRLDPTRPLPAPAALAQPGPPPPAEEEGFTLSRAVWKTITFRVIATSLDFTANLVASGSLATAATLSAFPIVIGPWIYLGHELAWERYGAPAGQRGALPGLGEETPWPAADARVAEVAP